ncbi:MAG TPA: hypothetical protein VGM68_02610 [Rhizomicrobium sp.]|jgi:hypothetical protein
MTVGNALRLACLWSALLILPATAQSDEIVLTGHIDTAMAARVHAALQIGKLKAIRIDSSGGEDLPALAIARDIAQSHAALTVAGVCAGPCANDLFPAASKRVLLPGALVIFSASASSRLAMVPPVRRKDVRPEYIQIALQEAQLVKNAAIFLEPQLQLQTACYSLTSRDGAGHSYINYRADFVGWIPSRAYLEKADIRFSGSWPKNADQFQAALKAAFPGGLRGEIRFAGGSAPLPAPKLLAQLGAIPECDKGAASGRAGAR